MATITFSLQSQAEAAGPNSHNDNPPPGREHRINSIKAEEDEYEVEKILDSMYDENNEVKYLVKWKGFPDEDTWEPIDHLEKCSLLVAQFHQRNPDRPPTTGPSNSDLQLAVRSEDEGMFHPGQTSRKGPTDHSLRHAKRRKTTSARIRIIRVYDDTGRKYTWNRRDSAWEDDQQQPQEKFAEYFPDLRNIFGSIEVRPRGVEPNLILEWDSTTGRYVRDDDYQRVSVGMDEIDELVKTPKEYQEVPWPKRKRWSG